MATCFRQSPRPSVAIRRDDRDGPRYHVLYFWRSFFDLLDCGKSVSLGNRDQ
jgi:hypothetical protein